MYRKPLDVGRTFFFTEAVWATEHQGRYGPVFIADTEKRYAAHPDRKLVISPERQLLVEPNFCIALDGTWVVRTRLAEVDAVLSFAQEIGREEIPRLFPDFQHYTQQIGAIPVTNVDWPEATPEMLAMHVYGLSYWKKGTALGQDLNEDRISRKMREHLAVLPLQQGIPLALKWLRKAFVPTPRPKLRERGFAA